jgi:putative transposase
LTHLWKSSGTKRTILWPYDPSPNLMQYLEDMRDAIRYGVMKSYLQWKKGGYISSSIDLRREIKQWFDSRYSYAKHHINPVCRSSIAILRSFRRNHHKKSYPEVKKLSIRLDSELVKIVGEKIRITIRPGEYEYIPINAGNKKWGEYSKYKIGELLITEKVIAISFIFPDNGLSDEKVGIDINFKSIDGTVVNKGEVKETFTEYIPNIARIQNDFSRRRRRLQKHIKNKKKRYRKLKESRGRERNRIRDTLHKLSSKIVSEHPESSYILDDLRAVKRNSNNKSKKLRTYLNRWSYSQFQKMLVYKSKFRSIYVNPEGTSSECPVCGGRLEHPVWKMSRCEKCGRDYDRDRLSSLAITFRGLYLCGDPFPVSAITSLPSVRDEYLYVNHRPDVIETSGTEMVNASNILVQDSIRP